MHILITDSGVGGLSVCAYAERFLRTHGFREPVRLTFVNAAPENHHGYNSMGSRQEKLDTFDRFLRSVTERYAPDSIYVACNTLSVLLPDTPYFAEAAIPVRGIVETGADLLLRELSRVEAKFVVIFGTVTTIEARTYPRLLRLRGVAESRIISQACPGLADTISEDREGSKTAAEIAKWVLAATRGVETAEASFLAFLACTHYGYRRELFSAAFADAGLRAEVLDPNEHAVGDLFGLDSGRERGTECEAEVEFVTRYPIPETTIETLTFFLERISPRTVEALRSFRHVPDLF